ncbi:MAG: hypothetical protein KDB10_13680, partial [Acidimicrobiales bacterium]|nr:hypothetical protein [Acidimicrobiales bacterium]
DPDPDGAVQAAAAVDAFLAVRGTEDERAVSSAAGRAELDTVIGSIGRSVPVSGPTCTTGPATGTFTCVLPTDQGDLAFTVGPDVDDPATSGFEVIGAAIA